MRQFIQYSNCEDFNFNRMGSTIKIFLFILHIINACLETSFKEQRIGGSLNVGKEYVFILVLSLRIMAGVCF